jgi:AraC family transcriptional regulator
VPAAAPSRISVLRNNELVPLLPSRQPGDHIIQPWRDVLLERHSVRPSEIPEHEHHELCMHLQLTGDANFEWWSAGRNGIEKTAPGSLILIPPGTRDRLRWQGASDRLILSVRADALQRRAEELDSAGDIEFANRWSLHDAPLTNLLTEMGREASAGWPLGALYANLLETNLTSHLLQRHAANPVRIPSIKGKLPMPRLRSAFEFIADNLHRDLTLDDIAKHLALSPFHFAREFRNSTGQTPYQYVLDQRIARAKQLLKLRTHSVQEVAYETGFQSPAHFIRAFHQRVGATPGAWRDS